MVTGGVDALHASVTQLIHVSLSQRPESGFAGGSVGHVAAESHKGNAAMLIGNHL